MKKTRRLTVFFIPPQKVINGGILSIFSICTTSREFKAIHKSDVRLCVYPGHESYKKNDLFLNDETIYSFDELIALGILDYLQLHIPEYASAEVFNKLAPYKEYLQAIPELRINILDQNILLMPAPLDLASWFTLTPHVTQTTAHDKYSTQAIADMYYIPTHHLSTFVDVRQYKRRAFEEKEDIILLSPDETENRSAIVQNLSEQFPTHELITVKDMRYDDYKDLISRARYTITFGEGFDGYFVEAFFTGGIAFAVYNEDFFPDTSFSSFENTYTSYEDMLRLLPNEMRKLNSKRLYEKVSKQNLDAINALYSFETYKQNLERFYAQEYTFLPSLESGRQVIAQLIEIRKKLEENIAGLKKDIAGLKGTVKAQEASIENGIEITQNLESTLVGMSNSLSWKVTKPLRRANKIIKKSGKST